MSVDGVFIQSVCQFFNFMVVQIKVCQRFVCVVFVDSPHSSNEDNVKLDFHKSLIMEVGDKHAVCAVLLLFQLKIRPSVSFLSLASCYVSVLFLFFLFPSFSYASPPKS